jgi:HEAT repeat protein
MPKREVEGDAAGLIAEALEAAQLIRTLGRADATTLRPIVAAVLAETARNRFPAATLLAGLTAEYKEARAVVAGLASDARWHVRKRALRCLGRNTPTAFAVEILRAALADENAEVRLKAASWAGFLGLEAALDVRMFGTEPSAREDRAGGS